MALQLFGEMKGNSFLRLDIYRDTFLEVVNICETADYPDTAID